MKEVRGVTLLVAEDQAINRMYILSLLEEAGYECVPARNGLEAVDVFRARRIGVVLMDFCMPVMDGLEAVREIRRIEAGRDPRAIVIALTARDDERDRRESEEAGVDHYLVKPFSEGDLVDIVDQAVASYRLSSADS